MPIWILTVLMPHSCLHTTYATSIRQWAYVHARFDVDYVEWRGGPTGDPNGVRARHEAQARDRLRKQVQSLQQLTLEAPQTQLPVKAARYDPVQFIQVRMTWSICN